jgi:hypothetical protein
MRFPKNKVGLARAPIEASIGGERGYYQPTRKRNLLIDTLGNFMRSDPDALDRSADLPAPDERIFRQRGERLLAGVKLSDRTDPGATKLTAPAPIIRMPSAIGSQTTMSLSTAGTLTYFLSCWPLDWLRYDGWPAAARHRLG